MNQKRLIIYGGIAVVLLLGLFIFWPSTEDNQRITAKVESGDLEVLVYTSGYLEAEKSEKIGIPKELYKRNLRIYELKITDLVEEGTYVDSGDYIGALDHATVQEVLKKAKEEYEQAIEGFEDSKMDSNLTLSNVRDQITTSREGVEEREIVLSESKYESPSTIRKAEMELAKAKRRLKQEIKGYALKVKQEKVKVERQAMNMKDIKERVGNLESLLTSLNIHAPKPGIVTYARMPWGESIKVGSSVSRWRSSIAELPDLSALISKTYVNEVDISKVKKDQQVEIGIDAYPEKRMTGKVISVANVGQPLPRSDAKVFEVKIRIDGSSKELKPAMTTSNVIHAGLHQSVARIPSDVIFENDTLQYVFVERGGVEKQIIEIGEENENFAVVVAGVELEEELLFIAPENEKDLPFVGTDIYDGILKKKEEEKRKREELAEKKAAEKKKRAQNQGAAKGMKMQK